MNVSFRRYLCFSILLLISLGSCSPDTKTLFTKLDASKTGIQFVNENVDTDTLSIIDYLYYYNGAGVSVGDINNDGLPDIYFASNTKGNKLFLNKGNFRFEDITTKAGVAALTDWTTGVTMADVNGDGFLDIYISTVSNHNPNVQHGQSHIYFRNSRNQLLINNHDNTFTEQAAEWGLALQGYNTQAVFFDYDKDGDLDMFQLQHSTHQTASYGNASLRDTYSEISGGKLLKNEGNHFVDVTKGSGIISSALGYGLGVGAADINHDGFDDLYVSNDFHENDYYYVNQGNGTFKEMSSVAFAHESKFSMGNDIADINNDGWLDIMTVDMLPSDEKVLKSSLGDDPLDIYSFLRKFGYANQYARNCLQLNIGRGMKFADIALYGGVAATDWSWSPLIADYNLDGKADLFVSNGIKNRPNDLDYIKFISNLSANNPTSGPREHDKEILAHLPPGNWHNYIFEGTDSLIFKDQSTAWGFGEASLSQGAGYADLDGDGDLDLVTNNINEPAGIYKNNARELNPANHYLSIQLIGEQPNKFAIGAKTFLFSQGDVFFKQVQTTRGFMSSGEPVLHFGLGDRKIIDSLLIIWPNNYSQLLKNIHCDSLLTIQYKQTGNQLLLNQRDYVAHSLHSSDNPILSDISEKLGTNFKHEEDDFFDFNDQWFIPHELSTQGPKLAVGDVNGDGLEDFFVCGAKNQAGVIYLAQKNGNFKTSFDSAVFVQDKNLEEVDALFFDADGDLDSDLYVVSGGNVYSGITPLLNDRLYINDGHGHFTRSETLPNMYENKSVVRSADVDHDGDLDLFVGGRSISKNYSKTPTSYLLLNDGKGKFTFSAEAISNSLQSLGMVTDASWVDIDNDNWLDLVIVGEWMKPTLFKNNHGMLVKSTLTNKDEALTGWWSCMKSADINGDGFDDLLLGNYGLNSKLTAKVGYPLNMYSKDINNIGKDDQIVAIAKGTEYYPFLNKEDIERQLPYIRKKFLDYGSMAGKTIEEIFGEKLNGAKLFSASTLASTLLLNDGKGHYIPMPLPAEFQWAPIFSFEVADLNNDGIKDILAGGNFFGTTPFEGRYDGMALTLGIGNNKGNFKAVLPLPTSFEKLNGEVRDIKSIQLSNKKVGFLLGVNNQKLLLFEAESQN